jgi:hypothetical protein
MSSRSGLEHDLDAALRLSRKISCPAGLVVTVRLHPDRVDDGVRAAAAGQLDKLA